MNAVSTPEELEEIDTYFDLGGGVAKDPSALHFGQVVPEELLSQEEPSPEYEYTPESKASRDPARPYDFFLGEGNQKEYSDDPSYADQYTRYPETVRKVGPLMEVFDLASPDSVLELNKLMAGAQSHHAPRSMVLILDKQWSEKTANWKILAQVYKFKYLKIVEKN
jgi:hypothetical protein